MAKDPAFLFYSSDFLVGTMTMTDEQVGKYTRLLCLQHQKGLLCEKDMMIICKSYDEDVFAKFTKDENGNYYNERLKLESEKRADYSKSRSDNRKKAKCFTYQDENLKNICLTCVNHMENVNENIICNSCYNKKNYKKSKKVEKVEIPELADIIKYFTENGFSIDLAQRFYKSYSANNWKDSQDKQVKNWKQKAHMVWFKDENKLQEEKTYSPHQPAPR